MRRTHATGPAALLAATLLALSLPASFAMAQDAPATQDQGDINEGDTPSVSVRPPDSTGEGPNAGAWFVYELEPGKSATGQAEIFNPADIEQRVVFDVTDVTFGPNATPIVGETKDDVGGWVTLSRSEAVIPAGAAILVDFTLAVPENAEPGDHIGAFTATTVNLQGTMNIQRRIARRLYVTVPGDVTPAWEIEDIDVTEYQALFPGTARVMVQLRNTGRVRVEPTVLVGDVPAEGSEVLLAKSAEQYVANVDIPWYGGPVSIPIEVTTPDGQVRTETASLFVIPVGVLMIAFLFAIIAFALRRWLKTRTSKAAKLREDIERLERALREQAGAGGAVPAPVVTGDADDEPAEEAAPDPRAELLQAAKRARRSSDAATLSAVARRLHEHDNNALELLLEAAAQQGPGADDLLDLAGSYGAAALSTNEADALAPEQRNLLERKVAEHLLGMHASPAKVEPEPTITLEDLAGVPGLGAAKQAALLDHFGSVEAVAAASVADLTEVKGVGPALAEKIAQHLDQTVDA